MANNIIASLDVLRRSVLSVIMNNTQIKFASINKSLEDYVMNGDSLFKSFMNLMSFNSDKLSSPQMSAAYMLSYMDFFTIYALMYSNYIPVFENLKNISQNKYAHIYNLYKELNATVKAKQAAQNYFFVLYSNFLFPNNIDILRSGFTNRGNKSSKPLSFDKVCTLPIRKKKEIIPSSITFFSNDGTISVNESETGLDYFRFEILRKQNNKIGTVKSSGVKAASNSVTSIPDVTGTIFGYFANNIYIEAKSVTKDANGILQSVTISGSTNGFDWSNDLEVNVGESTKIIIEDDIELGLEVTFYDGMTVRAGDRWKIEIQNIPIQQPSLTVNIDFDILEPVSYLKYLDTSSYKLFVTQSSIDRNRFSSEKVNSKVFDGRIGHIAVCEGTLNQYKTTLEQYDYDIQSKNGELYYKYDFKIADIKAYLCEYERHGSLVFDSIKVQNINTITVDPDWYLPQYKAHSIDYTADPIDQALKVSVPKTNIEFNIIAETDISHALIPVMPTDIVSDIVYYISDTKANLVTNYGSVANKGDFGVATTDGFTYIWDGSDFIKITEDISVDAPLIFEHVVPDSVDHNESYGNIEYAPAIYTTRFPVNETYDIKSGAHLLTYNSEQLTEAGSDYLISTKKVTISEYFMKDTHSVFYSPQINNITDVVDIVPNSKWVQAASNIYYTYYMDENKKVHLALREVDAEGNLVPFSGTISGQIEMRSIDDLYKTPMVFEYTLGMI